MGRDTYEELLSSFTAFDVYVNVPMKSMGVELFELGDLGLGTPRLRRL